MADSDEEDTLASFGTPFEPLEEDAPRKKAIPVHEQIVTDSEGRRRFHGAFTGGFSAGYFNSVGTKEGWQPSTFVSSRSKKFEPKAQRPEDFMDDEDMGEFGIAPKRITTTEEFLSKEKEIQNRRKRMVANREFPGVISGDHVLEDLVLPVKMSVGVELLKKMGWKEGQGVGPRERKTKKKVYGCSLPSSLQTDVIEEEEDIFAVGLLFAPKDTEIFSFTPKDDKHGFGYRGLDPSTALFGREDILGINPVSRKSGRKGFFGEAFGVGAFEEDDGDIYAADHMTNYDMELTSDQSTGLHGWTGPPKENMRGGELSIFTVTAKPMDSMKSFPPPVVPRDFDGNHKFDNLISPYEASQEGKTLTAADRGEMLGEEPLPTPKKSVFEYMSKEDKERVMLSSKSLTPKPASTASVTSAYSSTTVSTPRKWSSNVHFGSSSFKPFTKDPAKQARYEEFLKARNTEQACDSSNDSGLTEWEREREREEFIRSAALYQPLSSTLATRFTSAKQKDDHTTVYEDVPAQEASDMSEQTKAAKMKMFGKLTRDTFEWHPNNVLCKRFNIPNPYPGSDVIGVPKMRRVKFSLGDFLAPQTEKPRAILASSELEKERLGSSAGQISSLEVSQKSSEPTTSVPVETANNVVTNEAITSSDKTKQDDSNEAPQRPPMDLFKAIFADSSEDESNENDNDDDEETAVPPNPTESKTTPSFQVAEQTNVDVSVSDMFADISETSRGVLASGNGIETETTLRTDVQQQLESSDFQYGPTLPPDLRYGEASSSGHEKRSEHGSSGSSEHKSRTKEQTNSTKKRNSDLKTSLYSYEEKHSGKKIRWEDSQCNRHRKKDTGGKEERTKRYSSESSDSDEKNRSRHKHKRKEKKRSHRHKHTKKSKHRDEERNSDKKISENRSKQCAHDITVSNDKQILDKLKNLQNLKDGKRMKAIDFM